MNGPAPRNNLFPVFLKAEQLKILIVGGGAVGSEKLRFLIKSSPEADVTLVAFEISEEIKKLAHEFSSIKIFQKKFSSKDLSEKDIVIVATENQELNKQIWQRARKQKILTNVADTPELCDFYLGSIVTKGDLKIAISTNGKSPTFAKRLREMLEEILPDDIQTLLENLNQIRSKLKGDFARKVKTLNQITAKLIAKK